MYCTLLAFSESRSERRQLAAEKKSVEDMSENPTPIQAKIYKTKYSTPCQRPIAPALNRPETQGDIGHSKPIDDQGTPQEMMKTISIRTGQKNENGGGCDVARRAPPAASDTRPEGDEHHQEGDDEQGNHGAAHLGPLSVHIPSEPDIPTTITVSPPRSYVSSSRRSNSLQYEELSASARAHAQAVNQLLLAEGYDSHCDELQHLQSHALDMSEEGEEVATATPPPVPEPKIFYIFEPTGCFKEREDYSLWLFHPDNKIRLWCQGLVQRSWFDNLVLAFIGLNCITLAMERPNIPPHSRERLFLATANYVFTAVFAVEMIVKVIASNMLYGKEAYFTSGWNIMDGSLVIISIVDLLMSLISSSSPKIFGILRVVIMWDVMGKERRRNSGLSSSLRSTWSKENRKRFTHQITHIHAQGGGTTEH
ncbi:hypothetical protein FOCC_FOCC008496, partial [Frankliniella occidentalis]